MSSTVVSVSQKPTHLIPPRFLLHLYREVFDRSSPHVFTPSVNPVLFYLAPVGAGAFFLLEFQRVFYPVVRKNRDNDVAFCGVSRVCAVYNHPLRLVLSAAFHVCVRFKIIPTASCRFRAASQAIRLVVRLAQSQREALPDGDGRDGESPPPWHGACSPPRHTAPSPRSARNTARAPERQEKKAV